MKDNFLLKQLAQAVVDSSEVSYPGTANVYCAHCDAILNEKPHKPHCIVLVAEQILKGNEE